MGLGSTDPSHPGKKLGGMCSQGQTEKLLFECREKGHGPGLSGGKPRLA